MSLDKVLTECLAAGFYEVLYPDATVRFHQSFTERKASARFRAEDALKAIKAAGFTLGVAHAAGDSVDDTRFALFDPGTDTVEATVPPVPPVSRKPSPQQQIAVTKSRDRNGKKS